MDNVEEIRNDVVEETNSKRTIRLSLKKDTKEALEQIKKLLKLAEAQAKQFEETLNQISNAKVAIDFESEWL